LPGVAAIAAAVIAARFAWIVPAAYLERAILPSLRRRDPHLSIGLPLVMGWAGMRGAIGQSDESSLGPEARQGSIFIGGMRPDIDVNGVQPYSITKKA
jgi:NhaP-type Na+/H+ or K+/H+ antiporter